VTAATAKKRNRQTMAEKADIHELYEEAVQNVEDEVEFVQTTFRELQGREALTFREDFCGTASAACQWARTSERHSAIGVDIDPAVLDWGRQHRVGRLPEAGRARVRLVCADVREVTAEPVDVVGAFNFSYWLFTTREMMRAYFAHVRDGLVDDGVFFLDIYGGSEAYEETKEKTKYDGFTYIWHQETYEPITGRIVCHINFKFPDGSKIKKAFSYDWRLWTLPEIRELLTEAGFSTVRVYWEGTDEDGEGNGEFTEDATGEADAAYIAYIVAQK
jgi:SAM-dependent methyltransferase